MRPRTWPRMRKECILMLLVSWRPCGPMGRLWIWSRITWALSGWLLNTGTKLSGWSPKVLKFRLSIHHQGSDSFPFRAGMNIRWDYFVNQYDTARYVTSADGRENRHIQFVREFASVVSILQDKTNSVIDLYRNILRAVEDLSTC